MFLDSQAGVDCLTIGSKRPELHALVVPIYKMAIRNSWVLLPRWRRRSTHLGQMADDIGKAPEVNLQLDPA